MSNHKYWFIGLILLFILSACVQAAPSSSGSLAEAVSQGTLLSPEGQNVREMEYPTVEVRVGDITRYADLNVRVEGAVHRELFFERDGGRLSAMNAGQFQYVRKGDVLAEIVFDTEALETERRQLVLRINQFETQYANEDAAHIHALERARLFGHEMDEDDWDIHQLSLARRELEYERFIFNGSQTRLNFEKQLQDIDERLAGEQLIAPFDGIITFVFSGRIDSPVRSWTRMFTVVDDSSIYFSVSAPMDIVRYGDVFPVTDRSGDIRFDVRVVSDPIVTNLRDSTYTFTLYPADGNNFAGLMAEMEMSIVQMAQLNFHASPLAMAARNALIVPRRAVFPEDGKNYVLLNEDGIIKKRYVKIGFSFADEIQIITGLEAGQSVVLMP